MEGAQTTSTSITTIFCSHWVQLRMATSRGAALLPAAKSSANIPLRRRFWAQGLNRLYQDRDIDTL